MRQVDWAMDRDFAMIMGACRALALGAALMAAGPVAAQSRGELLYNTHCIACHSSQLHWRDNKQAVDWPSLLALVAQWQAQARLAWSADDIERVARYLNDRIYRFKAPPLALGRAAAPLQLAEARQTPADPR